MTKHLTYPSLEALSHGLDAAVYRLSRLEEATGTAPAGSATATAARIVQDNLPTPNGHEFTSAEIAGMAGKALADPKTAKGMRKMLGSLLTQTKDKPPRKAKAKKAKKR